LCVPRRYCEHSSKCGRQCAAPAQSVHRPTPNFVRFEVPTHLRRATKTLDCKFEVTGIWLESGKVPKKVSSLAGLRDDCGRDPGSLLTPHNQRWFDCCNAQWMARQGHLRKSPPGPLCQLSPVADVPPDRLGSFSVGSASGRMAAYTFLRDERCTHARRKARR
jgi:hypothetical protein